MKPILKWVGGKTQLLSEIKALLPDNFENRRYFEPFVGGGAVIFDLRPQNAVINDFNDELTNMYKAIKEKPLNLLACLGGGVYVNDEFHYYMIRNEDREKNFKRKGSHIRAARFIYLNHTCYNGLWRVNKKGQNNTPFGRYKNPKIYDKDAILEMSDYLQNVEIMTGDFQRVLDMAQAGDFVYLDPPYAPLTETASFTSYIPGGCDDEFQVRLRDACNELTERGVLWMLSNSSAPLVYELYQGYHIHEVQAKRAIAAKTESRHPVTELIITNYE